MISITLSVKKDRTVQHNTVIQFETYVDNINKENKTLYVTRAEKHDILYKETVILIRHAVINVCNLVQYIDE